MSRNIITVDKADTIPSIEIWTQGVSWGKITPNNIIKNGKQRREKKGVVI